MKKWILAAIAAASLGTVSQAAEPNENSFAVEGAGRLNCAAFTTQDTLVSVVQRMVTGLRPVRIAQFSPLVEVGDDKHQTIVYETILRRAQAALKVRGLYQGEEDGKFSPAMRDALIVFQQQTSLSPTGVPDPATLWTLLNP